LRLKQSIFANCHNQSRKHGSKTVEKPRPKAAETRQMPDAGMEITTPGKKSTITDFSRFPNQFGPPNHPTAKTKCPAPAAARVTRTLKSKPRNSVKIDVSIAAALSCAA
jgi:hypothetical protein